ncbi:MAG: tetratricopeptide repeat protein [Fulvivirga sp.]
MRSFLFHITFILITSISAVGQNTEIDSLSRLYKSNLDDTTQIIVLNELAFNYVYNNPSIAKDDVDIALNLASSIDYEKGIARSYNILGGINWAEGNYAMSLDYYLTSTEYYERLGDNLGLAKCYNNIGEIYKKLNELDRALDYLFKAKLVLEKAFGKDKSLLVYNNIAELYLQQGKLQKAEEYFMLVLERDQLSSERKDAYALTGLGDIAARKGKYLEAEKYYFDALAIRQQSQDNRGIASSYIKIGQLLNDQDLHDSAAIYFGKAHQSSQRIGARDLVLESMMGQVKNDSAKSDYKSALTTYFNYSLLKDSLFNEQKSEQIAQMQTAYETELLKKENEANLVKVKQQNTIVIGVIMALILCLAVAGAFYKQRQMQQTVNKLLSNKNKEIEDRNKEIDAQSKRLLELNKSLESLNEGLEEKVKIRTKMLRQQNDVLSQYAFTNAHELRAPVANILGLIHLLEKTELTERENDVVLHLKKATDQLDNVIKDIRARLESGEDLSLEYGKPSD